MLDSTGNKNEIIFDDYRNQDFHAAENCKKPSSKGKKAFCGNAIFSFFHLFTVFPLAE